MKLGSSYRAARTISAGVLLAAGASATAVAGGCVCIADINADGQVNGADLAFILGAWGTSNPAADLSGDGQVNGADIAIVLGNWGPCAGPANDSCGNVQVIGPGSYPFCNTLATTDGPALTLGLCGESATNIYKDLWYQFAPQSNGTMTVETCGATSFDTVIAIYSSAFPGLAPCPTDGPGLATLVACNDDSCGVQSKVVVNVIAGKHYKIRVGSWSVLQSGTGTLKLSFSHAGESCANSIVVNNAPTTVTIVGNTSDNAVANLPNNCFGSFPQGGAEWITYTSTCNGILTIDTCSPNTDFDTVLTVLRYEFDGNCWSTFIGCNDDSNAIGCTLNGQPRLSRLQVPCSPSEVFRIVVSGFNGASGEYALTINRNCN